MRLPKPLTARLLPAAAVTLGVAVCAVGFAFIHDAYDDPPGVRVERGLPLGDEKADRPSVDIAVLKKNLKLGQPLPVVVFFPGGGWVRDGGGYQHEIVKACRKGYLAVRLNYRLLEQGTQRGCFPSQLDDAKRLMNWLREHRAEYHADLTRIAFVGSSAGGHLALLAGLRLADAKIDAIVTYAAPVDLLAAYDYQGPHRQLLQDLLGGAPQDVPQQYHDASPIKHLTTESPPSLHFHGELDPHVPVTQALALELALARVEGEHTVKIYPGEKHMLRGQARQEASDLMYDFLAEKLGLSADKQSEKVTAIEPPAAR